MAPTEILSTYIKKLSHPLKEIRERALQLLLAKLQLGWELEDELSGTRELFEALIAWFHGHQPTLQEEALYLLLSTIKSKSGTYIAQEYGIKELLAKLSNFRHKIDPSAAELFEDVLDTLRFLNTVQSQEDVSVPQLNLHTMSATASETGSSSTAGYYNVDPNVQTSRETSVATSDIEINKSNMGSPEGIKLLLFPWVELCTSDAKTMLLIENALRVLKSTKRCCRFIRDVFLRDFPAEIFLNRPTIVQDLLAIVGGTNSAKIAEPLNVLLSITKELCVRIKQLSCLELVSDTEKIYDPCKEIDDHFNTELEQFASEAGIRSPCFKRDGLEPLRQLPAPIFALEALQAILSAMARSVMMEPGESSEVLDLTELNTCLTLVEKLIDLLLCCVDTTFWTVDHKTITHRDIAHKSCMIIRLLGDLLNKYRSSYLEDPERKHHRIAWIRLLSSTEILFRWTSESALSLKSLDEPLKFAQLDQALKLYYPELGERIDDIMEKKVISIDKEYKSKYKELTKLFQSMTEAVKFMKNKDNCRDSKQVLRCIERSLLILDLHLNESYLNDIGVILFESTKRWEMNDADWSSARNICLVLMAHSSDKVRAIFYGMLASMVKSCLVGEDEHQIENEKCLNLLCDVGVLTEICCHGLNDSSKEVTAASSDIMLYLLRGRLVLSERCWWRLLASCLPILPLLHVHVAPDTHLGQAISKSLESEIADCMGVPESEVLLGQVRLLFVKCPPIQMDAAHALCHILDDPKYLPPKETLRADVLISALRRVQPQDFNVDITKYSAKPTQTTGLSQILDVLKQDVTLGDEVQETRFNKQPTLEPSLRRATLQQLSVLMREPELHETFVHFDGIGIVVAILRMSLLVDDYLAFPECAISCVSVLNSICFGSRHTLAKIADLPALLLRVILIFPANESTVLMSAQVLSVLSWSGFALQELDESRKRVVSLPASVVQRTTLPFQCFSYWSISPNATHSSVEWLQTSEEWRSAIRTRWAFAWNPSLPLTTYPPGPLTLRLSKDEHKVIRNTCPMNACGVILTALQSASSHRDVHRALALLEGYATLIPISSTNNEVSMLPWSVTLSRFLSSPPASPRDVALLSTLLRLIAGYMDSVGHQEGALDWVKAALFEDNNSIISLLSREELYPQQSSQDHIEITQLHIHIVKVVVRCVVMMNEGGGMIMESLLKIMLSCLDGIDLKNFHVLGYLNELTRCVRYILNTRTAFSEQTLQECLQVLARIVRGIASGGGRKGQRCRLDALLAILAVLTQMADADVPPQRWSEHLNGDVIKAIVACASSPRSELRAVSLHMMALLAHHTIMLPQLLGAIEEESLAQFAASLFCRRGEASVVRAAAAALLAALASRATPHTDVHECDFLQQLSENNFIEHCIEILLEFLKDLDYTSSIEPNIPLAILESRSQLEVKAQKCSQVEVLPKKRGSPRSPSASLIVGAADALYNIVAFKHCAVQAWNELGLFRLLFKCTSWSNGSPADVAAVRASSSRALARAADRDTKVRATLANTKDCLHALLVGLTPLDDESDSNTLSAHTHALFLLSTLIIEGNASDTVWREIQEKFAGPFFYLLLQCLEFDESELQEAGMFCLTHLIQTVTNKKRIPYASEVSKLDLLDNLKSPYNVQTIKSSGDGTCQPEFMVEEICKVLMDLYKKIGVEKTKFQCEPDDLWSRTCACLSSVFALSTRSRDYAVHREFARTLVNTLTGIKEHLSLAGSPVDVIRTAESNPVLRALNSLLVLITSLMTNCLPAKEALADMGLGSALVRLWPWCMATDALRGSTLALLATFSNDCRKAWSSMTSCVGGRSLISEVSALCVREAQLAARGRPEGPLCIALQILRQGVADNHARAQIIKNGALTCVYKIRLAERSRRGLKAASSWASLAEAISRYPDGATALLELRNVLTSNATRAQVMPAIAHAAHFHRTTFLQAADLLELLSAALLTGETAEVVSAARAVWALAANNHKAKLTLRSAGVSSAVQSALQRFQRIKRDAATERALQLLCYTSAVLQAT